jgi:hypothetical protein
MSPDTWALLLIVFSSAFVIGWMEGRDKERDKAIKALSRYEAILTKTLTVIEACDKSFSKNNDYLKVLVDEVTEAPSNESR